MQEKLENKIAWSISLLHGGGLCKTKNWKTSLYKMNVCINPNDKILGLPENSTFKNGNYIAE